MQELGPSDKRLVDAAEGWLGLGDWRAANKELEALPPALRNHPEVLRVRWLVLAAEGNWQMAGRVARALCTSVPEVPWGWIYLARTAYQLSHTSEAKNVLLTVVDDFPKEPTLSYDLACYACQLGQLGEARQWLEKALFLDKTRQLERRALHEPGLQRLWKAPTAK